MLKTLSVAALIAATSTAAFAGSLAPYENTQVEDDKGVFVPATGSGIGAPVIIGGIVAAVAVAALVSDDDDEATDTTPSEED